MAGAKTGVDVLISVGGKVIGGQRGASFNPEVGTIDATYKQTSGWAYNIPGQGSWSVDTDGIVLFGEEGSSELEANTFELHRAFKEKEVVELSIEDENSGLNISGQAIMTSFPMEFPQDDVVTWSTSFQGQGEYELIAPGEAASGA